MVKIESDKLSLWLSAWQEYSNQGSRLGQRLILYADGYGKFMVEHGTALLYLGSNMHDAVAAFNSEVEKYGKV